MLVHPNIDPVAVQLGPLAIHWYGLMYLFGFAAAWYLGKKRCAQPWSPIKEEQLEDLIFYGALGVILGGRMGYVLFYNFEQFLSDPLWLLRVWEGGMAFHGGLLGVVVAIAVYARRINVSVFALWDFIAPLAPIGLGLGRLGNFIGQELWGRQTDSMFGMIFPNDPSQLPRHPSQLYQFALEGVLLFLILFFYTRRQRPALAPGALFLFCYGCFRFIVEFVREPDSHIGFDALGWMTRGQLLSLPMILLGAGIFVYAYRRAAAQGK
ncbi:MULTISPECIES: prolipoprotein diacylglyceryl transferase [Spongiibacter]|uniref:prolipoprotein diacylglyceryl transferase n=1 Tax=Spongiibacter TaxID=630749 RepID=UPI000C527DE6|nr:MULTISPECIES: prolipoprotein diacylglyceryl transferase [Spongiibacter]MAY38835.1 prolipoprotein diacylglyceryl transferase [Spongiibacter sp.]MBI57050.1 prolipoprotein diacylglyceryl transferase [Spongiibacter sp.]|tara:strand:+ start:256 stop:1053 length:798 start_codon:yes stop_codon:yes gene_type:complete